MENPSSFAPHQSRAHATGRRNARLVATGERGREQLTGQQADRNRAVGTARGAPVDLLRVLHARSPNMRSVVSSAEAVARTSAPVLILGETGTGKEVLARALHRRGPRAEGPFVPVNCGALPGELLESELFGHARGAFSGAIAERAGLFEQAAGGTLLLDEVADLPLALQVKLLRVLQDGEVRRVGQNRSTVIDVRVLAATHKDVDTLVTQGSFRADLYYRLKGFTLRLPPLRERTDDILPLARSFLAAERPACRLAPVTEALLTSHRWPGNLRELANAMRHAAVLAEGELVEPRHLPEELVRTPSSPSPAEALRTLAEVERAHVLAVLEACHGVQAAAARILGIARNTLARKLKEWEPPPRAPHPAAPPPAQSGVEPPG